MSQEMKQSYGQSSNLFVSRKASGDSIVMGRSTFVIRGVLDSEPGRRGGGFSLGPRVLVDRDALAGAGLLGFGSRANHQVMLKVDEARVEPLGKSLKDAFKNRFVTVRTFRSTENDLGEDLQRAENYLSLVGLVILVLGGIGVSSVTRVFIEQKLKSIAILKCVGATTRHVLGIYMTEILALGLAGSLLGVLLAGATLTALPAFVPATGPTGTPLQYGLTASAVGQGLAVGMLVALLFAIVPLLRVRRIRPSLLLRQEGGSGGRDWSGWLRRGPWRSRSSASPRGRPARCAWASWCVWGLSPSPSCCWARRGCWCA